ncbi:hypothetical protein E3N88_24445 [Mikania micrantha]|uniref:Uncharacterized protein n=1 Tax=Mikania micrantha TaxID=192012 RepID=A0A5N6N2G6_9ASTR|nr:hypothetical protein E3N88_24445 [Mikania micrantha]
MPPIHRRLVERVAIGRYEDEVTHPSAIKAFVAEFISVLIFVFAGQGSGMAFCKLTNDGATTPSGLIAAAIAHGLGLFVAVAVSANISGGHVNPAVTFGAFLVVISLCYVRSFTLLRSFLGRLWLVCFSTSLQTTTGFSLTAGLSVWNAFVFEIVMTFGLVYTVYATAIDPKKGEVGTIAPLAIGLIVGANILAGGPFTGAAMNPAVAFGPSLVSWSWGNHWIYWAGPLIGGGLAGAVYELIFISRTHEPLAGSDY